MAIAATYTLRVEGDSLHSNPSCRKESTALIEQVLLMRRKPLN